MQASTTQAAAKGAGAKTNSASNSGEDLGSTSTSSPDSKSPGLIATAKFADLTDENAKLKKDNEMLSTELAQAKKQCEELVAFLTKCVKVEPDQINRIMRQGSCGSNRDGLVSDEDEESCGKLKLFGVWLKGDGKKRVREESSIECGAGSRDMKNVELHAPLMKTSKVCN